ncbi:hypothetical protein [Peptostreptococcus porci]|uniref:hypothetical protein n=1 Tax=Peptostreptococcus porci TaxID=2652282 RepID=UPI002A82C472|nr:hypothetical protein [Peptostreptococcus porci]MDY4127729.1 hypothetical protein [Peptostreptococcus porci]
MKYVKLDDVKELLCVIDARDKYNDWTKSFEMFDEEVKILTKLLERNAIEINLKEE